jgi:hypothetical protein
MSRHNLLIRETCRGLLDVLGGPICRLTRKASYSASIKRFCQASRCFVSASTQVGEQNGKVGSCLASAGNLGSTGLSAGNEVGDLLLQAVSPAISNSNGSRNVFSLGFRIVGDSIYVISDLALQAQRVAEGSHPSIGRVALGHYECAVSLYGIQPPREVADGYQRSEDDPQPRREHPK